jgi:hypothetical protein
MLLGRQATSNGRLRPVLSPVERQRAGVVKTYAKAAPKEQGEVTSHLRQHDLVIAREDGRRHVTFCRRPQRCCEQCHQVVPSTRAFGALYAWGGGGSRLSLPLYIAP